MSDPAKAAMTKWGCIADDFTGATDLAGLIRRSGMSVIQCFGVPTKAINFDPYDVIVVALKSRSIAPDEACRLSLDAAKWLASVGVDRWFFKYCSTFDSTEQGNIGPVADTLAEWTGSTKTVFCPSFPENLRTVFQGHLFVGDKLLNESGMQDHPLNPMKDANLVRVLTSQSNRDVGLLPLSSLRRAEHAKNESDVFQPSILDDEIQALSEPFLITDAVSNGDLQAIAAWAVCQPLVTGGSAIAGAMAAQWMKNNHSKQHGRVGSSEGVTPFTAPDCEARSIVISGSCSLATQQQVKEFSKTFPACQVDVAALMEDFETELQRMKDFVSRHLGNRPLLVASTATADDVAEVASGHERHRVASEVERLLGEVAVAARDQGAERFVIAGGETSGAVVKRLGIDTVEVGSEISPGVPWIRSVGIRSDADQSSGEGSQKKRPVSLALKSGNFGSPQFFLEALQLEADQ